MKESERIRIKAPHSQFSFLRNLGALEVKLKVRKLFSALNNRSQKLVTPAKIEGQLSPGEIYQLCVNTA